MILYLWNAFTLQFIHSPQCSTYCTFCMDFKINNRFKSFCDLYPKCMVTLLWHGDGLLTVDCWRNGAIIFPGWPRHFHSCLDGFPVRNFFPVASWNWSKHRSLTWYDFENVSKTVKFWYIFKIITNLQTGKEAGLFSGFFKNFLFKKTDEKSSSNSGNCMVSPKNFTVDPTKNHSKTNLKSWRIREIQFWCHYGLNKNADILKISSPLGKRPFSSWQGR